MTLSLEAACQPYRSLAIAGTAKNAGKTTTLNYLIARFHQAGETLGLSSIGRDGEAIDQLTNRPKPRIRPPVGALVATSHESALYSQATLQKVADTAFRTALGPVAIYRVMSAGYVEVAGPVRVKEAAALLKQLEALGCSKVLLDGAADRRAFISAGVDGFILATGLVVSPDPAEVVAETQSVLARLQLPAPPDAWREACLRAGGAGALTATGWTPWPHDSFLGNEEAFKQWLPKDVQALYVPGAFTDGLAETLVALGQAPGVIVPAGTHLLASRAWLDRLLGRGARFYALTPLKAVALTLNPTAPDGTHVPPQAFLEAFHQAFPTMPVVDVEVGQEHPV
jgi:hypothetical protein